MGVLGGIRRFFFQKTSNDFDAGEAYRRNQLRYNALRSLDPDVLVRHLEAFGRGDICGLERVIDEFETREDKMRIGSFKMAAAVSSKPWEVRIRRGEEDNPRAKLHQERLTKFWNRVEATDAFCLNRRGGLRLLVKQMMQAQSRVYSVHDICWRVNGDGTLGATFTHVPAWCFENRTGRLRYIRNDCDTAGEEMRDGEWLVTVGEGVGIAAAVVAMAKRLSWNDWLLFSEKCGMPVVMGNTNAQRGTPAWDAMARAIRAVAPKTGLLADTGTTLSAVPMGAGGQQTFRELVETVDRAISALYRGGDLATQSGAPDSAGVNAQAGESELMDDDGCKMVSETLRDQVEKFVVRFELGDFEPLAEIVVNPPADTEDVEREMKIDMHLAGLGVKLSKRDALARYGRTEAEDEADALEPPQPAQPGGFGGFGLPNEAPAPQTPSSVVAKALQNARRGAGATDAPKDPETRSDAILRDFAADMGPAAKRIKSLLDALDAGKDVREEARKLAEELPELMADDPAMAAVIEEAMADAFAGAAGGKQSLNEADADKPPAAGVSGNAGYASGADKAGGEAALANEDQPRGKTTPESNSGSFAPAGGGSTGGESAEDEKKDKLTKKRERVATEKLEEKPVRPIVRFRKHPDSDTSAREAGYESLDDMLGRAERISESRVQEILSDPVPKRCTAAEGAAALASNPTIRDKAGNIVEVGENQIEKYCTGRFRARSKKTGKPLGPKVENFEVVPYMLTAVKNDKDAFAPQRVKYARGTTPDPLNTPFGAQREYRINTDSGPMHVFVYIKSTKDPKKGRINGWFVEGSGDGEA